MFSVWLQCVGRPSASATPSAFGPLHRGQSVARGVSAVSPGTGGLPGAIETATATNTKNNEYFITDETALLEFSKSLNSPLAKVYAKAFFARDFEELHLDMRTIHHSKYNC